MSVIRLAWAAITAGFVLALLAGLGLSVGVARHHAADEVQRASRNAAEALATEGGNLDATIALATRRAADERWAAVTVADAAGAKRLVRSDAHPHGNAPAAFAALIHLPVQPVLVPLPGGQGRVAVLARTDAAHDFLWTLAWSLALAIVASGGTLIGVLAWLLRWAKRPLEGFEDQIRALGERRFVSMAQPQVSEWVALSRALNVMVARVGLMLDEKDSRLEGLRKEMEQDALTGVASRAVFVERLKQELTDPQRLRVGAVVIVRAHDLVGMNQRVGRQRTDEFLRAVTTALRTRHYPHEAQGAVLARLNGSDFCLLLPGMGTAEATAWLQGAADALAGLHDEQIAESWHVAWIGATTYQFEEAFPDVMTRADAMVMASETRRERYCLTSPAEPLHLVAVTQWRVMIENALDTGHVQLAYYPVIGAGRTLLHREAMLRLKGPDGALLPAFAFIPPAIRTGRVLDLDLRAVELALADLATSDGDIAVNISPHSLRRPIFLRRMTDVLGRAGADAARLWIEVNEMGLSESPDELARFGAAMKPFGCKVGVEHFGHHVAALPRLGKLGVHYLKLDRAFCIGVHEEPGQQAFVRLAVEVASALSITVLAEGLNDIRDLQALERLGVAGATGPLVSGLVEAVAA